MAQNQKYGHLICSIKLIQKKKKKKTQIGGEMRFGEKLTSVGEGENFKSVGEMRFRDVGEAFSGLAVDVDE